MEESSEEERETAMYSGKRLLQLENEKLRPLKN